MKFKNIAASKALFKNEINNEHTPALLYIKSSCADWLTLGVKFSSTILAGIE